MENSDATNPFATPGKASKKITSTNKEKKLRTPSGQVLSNSVKDIRNFFSNESESVKMFISAEGQPIDETSQFENGAADAREWQLVKGTKSLRRSVRVRELGGIQPRNLTQQQLPSQQSALKANTFEADKQRLNTLDNFSDLGANAKTNQNESEKQTSVKLSPERSVKEKDEKSIQDINKEEKKGGTAAGGSTAVMDIQLVMKMFGELKKEITDLKLENQRRNDCIDLTRQAELDELMELRKEVSAYKQEKAILTSVVERLGHLYSDMEKKVHQIESNQMKKSVVIYGIQSNESIPKCQDKVEKFFEKLGIDNLEITECFKVGTEQNKSIVVSLNTMSQKSRIFQEMNVYKKKMKEAGIVQGVFVSDYIQPQIREQRRRERNIHKESVQQGAASNMNFQGAKLMIDKKQYQDRIKAPIATDILAMNEEQVNNICQTDIQDGQALEYKGSTFKGFILPTNSHLHIDQAYMKLRLMYPHAKHIICCYSITGMPRYEHEGYCDDNEHGGGKVLLSILKESNLQNVALFVVRLHSGLNIGKKRFELIGKAIEQAVIQNPKNTYTKQDMKINLQQPKPVLAPSVNAGPKYNRGGSNVRGRGSRSMRSTPRGNDTNNHVSKKRRQTSPPEMDPWTNGFNFSNPLIPNFAGSEQLHLGGSWPTLIQATKMS